VPESITMADVLFVPVDEESEPKRWGREEEMIVSVFGDFWRCRQSPESKGKQIRALAPEDLQELLRGRWSDVTHISYRPSADGYIKGRDSVLEMAIDGVTD
jgi:hypothetical protein